MGKRRFWASVFGYSGSGKSSTESGRGGATGVKTHARGWDSGISVRGYIDPETGQDAFHVIVTGGSNDDGAKKEIGTLIGDTWHPAT